MKCPICRADAKFVRTFETIQHRNLTERRKYCIRCSSAWKTMEEVFVKKENHYEEIIEKTTKRKSDSYLKNTERALR